MADCVYCSAFCDTSRRIGLFVQECIGMSTSVPVIIIGRDGCCSLNAFHPYACGFIQVFNQITVIIIVTYIIYSLTSIGLVLENRLVGRLSELFRCAFTATTLLIFLNTRMTLIAQLAITLFAFSAITWATNFAHDILLTGHTKKID